MKILVVGNGGREHALAWKFLRSERVKQVICIPGNGGTATLEGCINVPLLLDDFAGMRRLAEVQGVALTVVGPEVPLAQGIVDYFQEANLPIFGPSRLAAQIEASKSWAKDLMQAANVPTAPYQVCSDRETALAYLRECSFPTVIKADGLAAGKGVTIVRDIDSGIAAIQRLFEQRPQEPVVIEEFLAGEEVSVIGVTDGEVIRPLVAAQDHKRLGEGDSGPNTGGMGAYAPAPVLTAPLLERVQKTILAPTLSQLRARGITYRGFLYAGLMITPGGDPYVIEFNCRLGDPEAQVILPLLETPLESLLLACQEGRLGQFPPLQWQAGYCATVVLASEGYPDNPITDRLITGLENVPGDVWVFHAGTKRKDGQFYTSGGRVLNVTAVGEDLPAALTKVYRGISGIHFDGMYYRRDIGWRALSDRSQP
ncbi:MAG: phosphoribosylamine--glycine ligase [Pseudanabaenaceae cyanobacterium SKYGB_i_bin29]|nr:phosphoribosylamine--glycine ligase [Pseudanabaenaceae cyanobacterium SKYG29]MDW8420342.1 phosphoribosylamine--glycine ligase [Pseudanabaenaceae cyanobacterium SKYGB_i_bin29]